MPPLIDAYDLANVEMPVWESLVTEKRVPHEPVEITALMTWECWGYEDGTQPGDQHIFAGGLWVPLHYGPYPDDTQPLPTLPEEKSREQIPDA